MPINKKEGESQDEFISRCIGIEVGDGKSQEQAAAICYSYADEYFKSATPSVSDATWSTEAPININLESYNDYPEAASNAAKRALKWVEKNGWGSCGEATGKRRANQLANREPITEETIARMASFARHKQNSETPYGEGCGKLMWDSWGGSAGIEWASRKLKQIRKEKLQSNFKKQKRVIFNEDFDPEIVKNYKDAGFKVYVRSARKIKKSDHKVWNKLKTIGLNEDAMVFGEVKDLEKRYKFDLHMTGNDPILEALLAKGQTIKFKQVLQEYPITSIQDAEQKEAEVLANIDLRFVSVKVVYTYGEIPNIPEAKSGSREFCQKLMENKDLTYTLDQIRNLPNRHLVEMFDKYSIEPDVFAYRGGFYRLPGTQTTTPWCRHEWRAKVVIV